MKMMRGKPIEELAFVFGPFRLIPSQQLLVREMQFVKLGGRALDILHLLVTRAGEEVSKSDLIEWAWPNVFVDEQNLKVHISSLRRALEDTFPQATYIATVVGRGYRFVARVQTESVVIGDFSIGDEPVPCSLPAASPLIGRQSDVESVARTLDLTTLVTLIGPGGVGKTSLAIAVAHARRDDFPDGVHYVDLSTTDDPAFVPNVIATGLGIRGNLKDLISAVVEHVRGRRMLIVLDNCEHVVHDAAAIAARLVEAEIRGCILATSREPLGVINERLQRVEPLAFPHRADVRSASDALAYPSIELFALRARGAADYQMVDRDVHVVASVCEALDGLPLAIEIASAKLVQFSPMQLLESMGRHLRELRNDDEATHPRHRTLWATLDWSYQLLSTEEAAMFRLLSVFAGSFEWTDGVGMARVEQYDPYQITTALGGLVAKSLVSVETDGEQLRYRLLDSARCYAAERLVQNPRAHAAQRHHAQLVLAVFEKSEAEWSLVDNRVWRERYERRIGDLRKALDWCFSVGGDASLGVDLATSAVRLWNEYSFMSEQQFQVDRALSHCASMANVPRRQATLATSRAWSMILGRQSQCETDGAWKSALDCAELSGDVGQQLSVMSGWAHFLIYTGRNEQAVSLLDEFIQTAAQVGDRASVFDGERLSSLAEMHLGRLDDVRAKLERLAGDLARGVPPSRITRYQEQRYVSIHGTLAFANWLTGQPESALALAEKLVLQTGEVGLLMGQSHILALVAMPLALWSGQTDSLERYSTILRRNLDCETIAMWEPVQRFYASAARYARGHLNAVDDMRSAVDELVRDGFLVRTAMYLGVLAEALLEGERVADAAEAIECALAMQRRSKEIWCLPELDRVKARILAALGERDHARAVLDEALENARTAGARSFEVWIVNDMAQMAIDGGNKEEAFELLAPQYGSFEERTAINDPKRSARLLTVAGACQAAYNAATGSAGFGTLCRSESRSSHR